MGRARAVGARRGPVTRAWLSWPGDLNGAMALHELRAEAGLDVVGLLTAVQGTSERGAMHGARRELLEAQASRVGLPLQVVELPWPCPNEEYESQMSRAVGVAAADGVEAIAFADLVGDLRASRERALDRSGVRAVFPLWGRPTEPLAREMLGLGLRAILTSVDPTQVPASFAGRPFDAGLLDELPAEVDRCGAHGEFRTLAVDGPAFSDPLDVVLGEIYARDGFVFADVLTVKDPTR